MASAKKLTGLALSALCLLLSACANVSAQKAPAKVLAEHRQRLADWEAKVKQIERSVADLPVNL